MTVRLHHDEVRIDEHLVQQLLRAQLSDLANQISDWTRARGWALTQGLEALPYYLDTHPGMVAMAHRVIRATLS